MLKKSVSFIILLAIVIMAMGSGLTVSAALGSDGPLANGIVIIDATYECVEGASALLGYVSGTSASSSRTRWQRFFKLDGNSVIKMTSNSAGTELFKLTYGKTYQITIKYNKNIDESTNSNYNIYVNGVNTAYAEDIQHTKNHVLDSLYSDTCFSVSDVIEGSGITYDMTPYSAVLTSASDDIVLGGSDVNGSTVFGGFVCKFEDGKTVADVKSALTLPSGSASVAFTRDGAELDDDIVMQSGDVISVTSANKRVINDYTVELTVPVISSDVYNVNTINETIKNVLSYTPVDKFISNFTLADGCEIDGVYNGETKVTDGVVTNGMVLRVAYGDNTVSYTVSLLESNIYSSGQSYDIPGGYYKVGTGGVGNLMVDITLNYTDSSKSFYLMPASESTKSYNLLFKADATTGLVSIGTNDKIKIDENIFKMEKGNTYNFKIILNQDNGSVNLYCNGNFIGKATSKEVQEYVFSYNAAWTKLHSYSTDISSNSATVTLTMIDSLDAYMESLGYNDITVDYEAQKLSVKASASSTLFVAVYSNPGKLDSVSIYNISQEDNNKIVDFPADIDGKTVNAFLWSSALRPIDSEVIQ